MSDIKKYFKSDLGYIVEFDYSQLEVIILAHLSQDPTLIRDLELGLDMHRLRAAELYGIHESAVTPHQRRIAKGLSFQLQYGAGAKSMAEKEHIPLAKAKKFISQYYKRYPDVKQFQNNVMAEVRSSKKLAKDIEGKTLKTASGYPAHFGHYPSQTGRLYSFITYDAPEWLPEETGFSPTQMKNYPIQGLATADIVPIVFGQVNRWLYKNGLNNQAHMIATTHDSIVLDIRTDLVYTISTEIKNLMENLPKRIFKQVFGVDLALPLKVDATMGRNWYDREELKL